MTPGGWEKAHEKANASRGADAKPRDLNGEPGYRIKEVSMKAAIPPLPLHGRKNAATADDEITRVMICDRHNFYRDWLRAQLKDEDDILIVSEVDDADAALEITLDVAPDVLVVELETRTISGVELGRRLREKLPELKVIVLAASEEEVGLTRLLAMKGGGADACLLTDAAKGEIAAAIRAVGKGRWVAARAITEPLLEELFKMVVAERSHPFVCPNCGHVWTHQSPLTDREVTILRFVGMGFTNTAIANELGLSEGTIKNYVHDLLEKLELGSRLEAAVYAAKEGLV